MTKKCQFFTFFRVTRQNFLGSRWNISTNEPVLERLLYFLIFVTYFKLIAHLVRAKEPPKVKKSKIRVTRKPDLETQNWVYSFSSVIELYQTHIVTAQMLFDCWTVFAVKSWTSRFSTLLFFPLKKWIKKSKTMNSKLHEFNGDAWLFLMDKIAFNLMKAFK